MKQMTDVSTGLRRNPPEGQSTGNDTPSEARPAASQTSSSSASLLTALDDRKAWPTWLEMQYERLSKVDKGRVWSETLALWVEIEKQFRYQEKTVSYSISVTYSPSMNFLQEPKNLTSTSCPPEVAQWIARARRVQYTPIVNVNKYELQWWAWWTKCQPTWRSGDLRNATDFVVPVNADWSQIKRGGLNGILSVLIALAFWRDCISQDCFVWNQAVEDVRRAFNACVAT